NLFNYVDRYVLASVLPTLKHEFLAGDPNQNGKAGLWTTAFLVSYMFTAPIFGWLADRFSRWILIGSSVALWSLASGWSGLATSLRSCSARDYSLVSARPAMVPPRR